MKLAIVYYSRTGNTENLVKMSSEYLKSRGIEVDVYKVKPLKEYSPPLHLNPRLIIDTLIKKGTNISLEPKDLLNEKYDMVIVALPIWFNRLSPPIQELLKKYGSMFGRFVILIVSQLKINCNTVLKKVVEQIHIEPTLCINITVSEIRDKTMLMQRLEGLVSIVNKALGVLR
jgi:menaquinone-dependent protoporphyrinogen IX oxidase